ncbi:MAG: hypothetical protein OEQ29_12165, partial [Alphaproteobacteria bacterium]|nr:hypothetical protein [Alphaproteobacteria bacterium]
LGDVSRLIVMVPSRVRQRRGELLNKFPTGGSHHYKPVRPGEADRIERLIEFVFRCFGEQQDVCHDTCAEQAEEDRCSDPPATLTSHIAPAYHSSVHSGRSTQVSMILCRGSGRYEGVL